jgi:hypothetical protein
VDEVLHTPVLAVALPVEPATLGQPDILLRLS